MSGIGPVSLRRQKMLWNKMLMAIFSLVFLLPGTGSLFQISCHYIQRTNTFPIIMDFNADWSAYRNLRFKVASGYGENMDLLVRIHDRKHDYNCQDRFNQKLKIHPELNEIIIPLAQIEKRAA